jgi:hypothetical protein
MPRLRFETSTTRISVERYHYANPAEQYLLFFTGVKLASWSKGKQYIESKEFNLMPCSPVKVNRYFGRISPPSSRPEGKPSKKKKKKP